MKKTVFFLLYLFCANALYAQDIAPGQQAQGYLDGKNVSVDHSTGIFHYQVPLYTLGNGGFSLPITLDYAAKGVKMEDRPGLVGYNWTLNTGGIVSRTIRGGIADEEYYFGYLYYLKQSDTTPLANDVKKINRHQRDGESDLFTVVFNGQSVHFILRLDENNKICATPLERTNIRIQCEQDDYLTINGWVITDEEGNRYIYRQKEWSADIVREEAISFNGLRGKSYVSSWYLSRIEPVNGAPILYHYEKEVLPERKQEGVAYTNLGYGYMTRYHYGVALREYTFDFAPYKSDFDEAISRARSWLNGFSIEQQINNPLNEYIGAGQWARNPNFEKGVEAINANFRIMGQLAEFRNISSASNELIQMLEQLYTTYSSQSSHNAQMAASCFKEAKGYVMESLKKVEQVTEREVASGTSMSVRSPLVSKIVCGNRIIHFRYNGYGTEYYLASLKLCDAVGNRLSEVGLANYSYFNRLSFLDKDSLEIKHLDFEYYIRPSGSSLISDAWGYPKESKGVEDERYLPDTDVEYSRIASLKTITFPDGGKLHLDYESNQSINNYYPDPSSADYAVSYGGIRLKSLVYEDGVSASNDTVRYCYPLPGIPVYTDVTNTEVLNYSGFSDHLMHTRMKNKGLAFLNMGNNGIYYRYVQEIRSGQGMQAYLFHVPFRFGLRGHETMYPFWLNGLPLAMAIYNEAGQLVRLTQNHYYTDLSKIYSDFDLNYNADYFSQSVTQFGYNDNVLQLKSDEYYMDAEYLESYYRNQQDIFLYSDGTTYYYLNPYVAIYRPNIEPRTSRVSSERPYMLHYGGKTLLKSQKEYHFEKPVNSSAGINDFSRGTEGTLYQSIEYFYDNPERSVRPVRIIRTDSRGDVYTTVVKRVTEMTAAADETITSLEAANVVSVPIKEIHLKNGTLLDETVCIYTVQAKEERYGIGLQNCYRYVPSQPVVYSMSLPDPSLFTYGRNNYTLEEENDYQWKHQLFLLSDSRDRMSENAVYYDYTAGRPILEATEVSSSKIVATDLHPFMELRDVAQHFDRYVEINIAYKNFYQTALFLRQQDNSEDFRQYLVSSEHRNVFRLIEMITMEETSDWQEMKSLQDSIVLNPQSFYNFYRLYSIELQQRFDEEKATQNQRYLQAIEYSIFSNMIFNPLFQQIGSIDPENLKPELNFSIASFPDSGLLHLYVLCKTATEGIRYRVRHAGGVTSGTIQLEKTSEYSLQRLGIDISGYTGVTSVEIDLPALIENIDYFALVPAGTVFTATSYNVDGTVFSVFDQTGQWEVNEYDRSGHLLRTKDAQGKLLQSYQYNVANP